MPTSEASILGLPSQDGTAPPVGSGAIKSTQTLCQRSWTLDGYITLYDETSMIRVKH